jgi:hypothetical protein
MTALALEPLRIRIVNHGGVTMTPPAVARAIPRWQLIGLALPTLLGAIALCRVTTARAQMDPAASAPPGRFIEITPAQGRTPVHLAVSQVVRVGRLENFTTIDTAAWVQQQTNEPVEAVARRLREAGQLLVALTDLNNGRVYLALERIVLVRDSNERHAAGARAAIVMVGLRYTTDVAVRETAQDVMAAIRREGLISPASDRSPAATMRR